MSQNLEMNGYISQYRFDRDYKVLRTCKKIRFTHVENVLSTSARKRVARCRYSANFDVDNVPRFDRPFMNKVYSILQEVEHHEHI